MPGPCRGAAWAGKGSRALVLCVAAVKTGRRSSTVLMPSSCCKGLILPSFPKPNVSQVPLAGLPGLGGRGCRAGAEFVPWGSPWVDIPRAWDEHSGHEEAPKDPTELSEPHGREFPRMGRPHSRALTVGESVIPQHRSPLQAGGQGARPPRRDLRSGGKQRGPTQGHLHKVYILFNFFKIFFFNYSVLNTWCDAPGPSGSGHADLR